MRSNPEIGLALAVALLVAGPALAEDADAQRYVPWMDLQIRADAVRDLPGGRDDIDRARVRFRVGARRVFGTRFEIGAGLVAALATDDNAATAPNLDNEKRDEFDFDQGFLRWHPTPAHTIQAGRTALPVALGPMIWDQDLRVLGVSWSVAVPVRRFDQLLVTVGRFEPDHPLGGTSKLTLAQLEWRLREGARTSAAVTLTALDFGRPEGFPAAGISRTNRVSMANLVSEYELLDVQLVVWSRAAGVPIRMALDLVENLGGVADDQGVHFSLSAGSSKKPGGWSGGVAFQRVERDAVLAAFNSDDWWFPSWTRATRVALSRGLPKNWRARVALFRDRRDDLSEPLYRALLDFEWRGGG